VFRLSHEGSDIALDAERWERVEHALRGVLGGEIDVEALVERSRRPSRFARPRRPVPTRIEIDNTVSREHTVLDVYTADRVGLLFTITNCLYHLGLEIHLAKITTMVDQVLDVFYVTDHQGRKIEDPARLEAIREALARALEIDGTAAAGEGGGGDRRRDRRLPRPPDQRARRRPQHDGGVRARPGGVRGLPRPARRAGGRGHRPGRDARARDGSRRARSLAPQSGPGPRR